MGNLKAATLHKSARALAPAMYWNISLYKNGVGSGVPGGEILSSVGIVIVLLAMSVSSSLLGPPNVSRKALSLMLVRQWPGVQTTCTQPKSQINKAVSTKPTLLNWHGFINAKPVFRCSGNHMF